MTGRLRALLCLPIMYGLPACGDSAAPATPLHEPRPATLRRLTRTEYNHTARDLLGNGQRLGDRFPEDDVAHGFDNIAQVLSVSPLHVDLWQRAAEALATEALRPDGAPVQKQFGPERFHRSSGVIIRGDDLVFTANAGISTLFELPLDGKYTVFVRAYEDHAGADVAHMELSIDHRPPQVVPVAATAALPQVYQVEADLFAGPHELSITFTNALPGPGPGSDRALAVSWVRVMGPAGLSRPNPQRAQILSCTPGTAAEEQACARQILGRLARLAWRRPPSSEELARVLGLFQLGLAEESDFESGIRVALQGILMSPHFLYHVELDPDPTSPTAHPLTAFELASRLSYFLWSSAPDEPLLQQAESGGLADRDGVTAQVTRMLADPRAAALVDNFAAQWLALRALDSTEPDVMAYPSFRPSLRVAMAEETRRFLHEFFPQPGTAAPQLGLQQLASASFTFVNQELSRHYGLPGPADLSWLRVPLDGTARRGLLTQGSVLLSTSYPSRTSPVRRGKWLLEQLLCSPPPPPPADVLGDFEKGPTTGTLRQRLEQHRRDPFCASCHKSLDPMGFALENFDGIGSYRTLDGGAPVDASGTLLDGRSFKDATELAALLAADPQLGRCALEKMFTYALGRAPTDDDQASLATMHGQLVPGGYLARELVLQIVLSDAFGRRRGEALPASQPTHRPTGDVQGGTP